MTDASGLQLSPDASPDEAAAIIAAIEQLLAAEARAVVAPDRNDDAWAGRRFAFAGRLTHLTGEPRRPPAGLPADPWTAAGRVERR